MRHLGSLFFLLVLSANVSDAVETTPKAQTWKGNAASGVLVQVDRASRGVFVTLNKDKDKVPHSIGITFINKAGKRTTLELKTMEPGSDSVSHSGATPPRYSGNLSSSAQSFVGFELKIPFGSQTSKIIRSQDLEQVK